MKKESAFLLTVALTATGLWVSAVSLSERLARPAESPARATAARDDGKIGELRRRYAEHPDDATAGRELGDALAESGLQSGDTSILADALETYLAVLEKAPSDKATLSGIANLSFQAGVLDKAAEYYERYLQLEPTDAKTKNDLALVYIQSNDPARAIPLLEEIKKSNPELFPPALSLALAYRGTGDEAQAKREAARARTLAPDDQAREVVDRFVNSTVGAAVPSPTPDEKSKALASPAGTINEFFRNHPILGPKVAAIRWASPERAIVELRDFPVDKMPPFARTKLEERVKQMLAGLSEPIELEVQDANSHAVLMSFSAPHR